MNGWYSSLYLVKLLHTHFVFTGNLFVAIVSLYAKAAFLSFYSLHYFAFTCEPLLKSYCGKYFFDTFIVERNISLIHKKGFGKRNACCFDGGKNIRDRKYYCFNKSVKLKKGVLRWLIVFIQSAVGYHSFLRYGITTPDNSGGLF